MRMISMPVRIFYILLFLFDSFDSDSLVTDENTLRRMSAGGQEATQPPTLPLYGSGGLHLRTLAANKPNWCLSMQLRTIFVG